MKEEVLPWNISEYKVIANWYFFTRKLKDIELQSIDGNEHYFRNIIIVSLYYRYSNVKSNLENQYRQIQTLETLVKEYGNT